MALNRLEFEDGKRVTVKNGIDPDNDMGWYTAIGRLNMSNSRSSDFPDFSTMIVSLSRGAQKLWDAGIKRRTNARTNLCCFPTNRMTKSQKAAYYRQLRELIKVELVKRARTLNELEPVPKGTLMVNPYVIIPSRKARVIQSYWDLL